MTGRMSGAVGLGALALSPALAVSGLPLSWPSQPLAPSAPSRPARVPEVPRRLDRSAVLPDDERVLVPNGRAVKVGRFRSELSRASDATWSLLEIHEADRSVDLTIEVAVFTHPSRDDACRTAAELTRDLLDVNNVYVQFHFPWVRGTRVYECPGRVSG